MPTQFRNLGSFIPIDAQWDLGFLGTGSHLLHPRGIFKNLSFWPTTSEFFFDLLLFDGNEHGIPIQSSPMWTIWCSVNIISILTGEVGLWLDAPVDGIQLCAPCSCLAGWENSTNQLALEMSSPVGRMQTILDRGCALRLHKELFIWH